jgi:hypothetical protein
MHLVFNPHRTMLTEYKMIYRPLVTTAFILHWIFGFRSGSVDVSILRLHGAASRDHRYPTFRGGVVVAFSKVKRQVKNIQNIE